MTVIGAHVEAGARGVMWADTDLYHDDVLIGAVTKLIANPTARLIGAFAGWDSLAREFNHFTTGATDLARLLIDLPPALRAASPRAANARKRPEDFLGNVGIVVGWHEAFRRVIAIEFSADRFFVPEQKPTIMHPAEPLALALDAPDMLEIAGIAEMQLATLRRSLPTTRGRQVVMAEVTEAGIKAWPNVVSGHQQKERK